MLLTGSSKKINKKLNFDNTYEAPMRPKGGQNKRVIPIEQPKEKPHNDDFPTPKRREKDLFNFNYVKI